MIPMPAYFKPSTLKSVVCAALVRIDGLAEPMFLYFDGIKNHGVQNIDQQLKRHWASTHLPSEPLPPYQVIASQEFPSQQQDISALSLWLQAVLPKARAF